VRGCVCVGGSVTTITRNCVHRSSPNWIVGKCSDHLQLTKFWPSRAPGKGSAAGQNFLAPPYYSQRAVFASPLSAFFIVEYPTLAFCADYYCELFLSWVKKKETVI